MFKNREHIKPHHDNVTCPIFTGEATAASPQEPPQFGRLDVQMTKPLDALVRLVGLIHALVVYPRNSSLCRAIPIIPMLSHATGMSPNQIEL